MTNRIQLKRSATPGSVPALLDLLTGEMALNMPDKDIFYNNGAEVVQLNAALNIRQDATHRMVSDSQISVWTAGYTLPVSSPSTLGGVKVGANIDVDGAGVISLKLASAADTGVLTATDWATFNNKQNDLGYVPVNQAGDTMSGLLTLSGAPTLGNHATTKTYTDGGLALKLNLAGGTMSGPLVLSVNPTDNLGAATKQYVDTAVAVLSGQYGAPVQAIADLVALAGGSLDDKMLRLVEDTGSIYSYDAQSTAVADNIDVVTPSGGIGRWIKISSAIQNHEVLSGLLGGAAGDHLHLTTAEKNSYDAHLTDYQQHLTSDQNTWLDGVNASAAEVNWSVGVTSSIQTQLNGKEATIGYTTVNKAGDTMLGMLALFANPVAAMDAATKQYVDDRVIDCGAY